MTAGGRVVVLGAGFAGLAAARRLSRALLEVLVVDQHNFHTFQPLLYQVATAGLGTSDVAYPVRTIFRSSDNVHFEHGRVSEVDLAAHAVRMTGGRSLDYDYLVVATGATAATFGVPGVTEHALFLYSLDDARWVRNEVLAALERADGPAGNDGTPLVIAVVGGGPTGVETAGAMSELLDIAVRHDRLGVGPARARVVLLDANDRLLPGFSAAASAYAERTLRDRGVEVRLGAQVTGVTSDGLLLAVGERVDAEVVVWAAGVTVQGTIAAGLPGERASGGRLVVGPDLSLPGHPDVFVVGDAAAINAGRQGPGGKRDLLPQVAQVAIQSGDHAAQQILARVEGSPSSEFVYRDKGMMATIGRRSAVAQFPHGRVVTGTTGWLAWMLLHLVYLIGFRNRAVVLVNWAWNYLEWPSGPRLIVGDVPSRPRGGAGCLECSDISGAPVPARDRRPMASSEVWQEISTGRR